MYEVECQTSRDFLARAHQNFAPLVVPEINYFTLIALKTNGMLLVLEASLTLPLEAVNILYKYNMVDRP